MSRMLTCTQQNRINCPAVAAADLDLLDHSVVLELSQSTMRSMESPARWGLSFIQPAHTIRTR
jgi:hypothetical protein